MSLLALMAPSLAAADAPPHSFWIELSGQALVDRVDLELGEISSSFAGSALLRQTFGTEIHDDLAARLDVQWAILNPHIHFTNQHAELDPGDEAQVLEIEADLVVRVIGPLNIYTWEGTVEAPLKLALTDDEDDGVGVAVVGGEGAPEYAMETTSYPHPFLVEDSLQTFFRYAVGHAVGSWYDPDGAFAGDADFDALDGLIEGGLPLLASAPIPLPEPPFGTIDPSADWVLAMRPGPAGTGSFPAIALVHTPVSASEIPDFMPGLAWAHEGEGSVGLHAPAELLEGDLQERAVAAANNVLDSEAVEVGLVVLTDARVPLYSKFGPGFTNAEGNFEATFAKGVFTPDSTEVVGVNSIWTQTAEAGFLVAGPGVAMIDGVHIAEIVDDTHLILDQPWPGNATPDAEAGGFFRAMREPSVEVYPWEHTAGARLTLVDTEFFFERTFEVLLSDCDLSTDVDMNLSLDVTLSVDQPAEWIRAEAMAYPVVTPSNISIDCPDAFSQGAANSGLPDLLFGIIDQIETQVFQTELPIEGLLERSLNQSLGSLIDGNTDFVPEDMRLNQELGLWMSGLLVPMRGQVDNFTMFFNCDDPSVCGQSDTSFSDSEDVLAMDVVSYLFPMLPQSTVGPVWDDWSVTLAANSDLGEVFADNAQSLSELAWSGAFEVDEWPGGAVHLEPGDLFRVGSSLFLFQSVTVSDHEWGDPLFHWKRVWDQDQLPVPVIWESLDVGAEATATVIGEGAGTSTILQPTPGGGVDVITVSVSDVETYRIDLDFHFQWGVFGWDDSAATRVFWDGVQVDVNSWSFEVDADDLYSPTVHDLRIEYDVIFEGGAMITVVGADRVNLANVIYVGGGSTGSTGPVEEFIGGDSIAETSLLGNPWDPRVGDPAELYDPRRQQTQQRQSSTPRR
ncbi:MAG: hypothetical protein GY898_10370 [Proteobacteria bacterium]|nr:hypothetical protein [Pseudomonadota bacterium]